MMFRKKVIICLVVIFIISLSLFILVNLIKTDGKVIYFGIDFGEPRNLKTDKKVERGLSDIGAEDKRKS